MGLESLFIFTLLGGMAAGTYLFETLLQRKREGERPWLMSLVVAILFAVACTAAATHVESFPNLFASVFTNGTVNFGAGMVQEVAVAGIFLVLVIVDLAITAAKKEAPFALRVVTALVGVAAIVMMAHAYTNSYRDPIWCNAPATIASFTFGGLATGYALYALMAKLDFRESKPRTWLFVLAALNAVGIVAEIAAFAMEGANPALLIAGFALSPVAVVALAACAPKFSNQKVLNALVFVCMLVGVAICRWAFYATMGM